LTPWYAGRSFSAGRALAQDKAGQWDAWYPKAIPLAEQRYEDYLKQEASQ
jgi:hypothetical protein